MKTLKVKFQNKKKKANQKIKQKQESGHTQDHSHIGFLLRENTDTQKAKNQLRKASEEVFYESPEIRNEPSWGNQNHDLPFSWLDQITENQVRDIVRSKTGNSEFEDSPDAKHPILSSLSYGQIKPRSRLNFMTYYQDLQANLLSKKSSICYLRTQKSQQKNLRKSNESTQNPNPNSTLNKYKRNVYENSNNLITSKKIQSEEFSEELKKSHSRYMSTAALKRSRVLLVTPKIKEQSGNSQGCQGGSKKHKINGVSTVYFKVPEFHNKSNLKRAVTVHCQSNSRESLPHPKKNFYLKKTNTICIVQKQLQQANKCISLSNYKSIGYTKKSKLATQPEPSQKSTTELSHPSHPRQKQRPQNSTENLKENLNKLTMEKAAKTMMLRQEFQRLRKLLKKEAVVEFQVDQDSPIRITKL